MIVRMMILSALCVVNSGVLASVCRQTQMSALVGAAAVCNNDCTMGNPNTQGECLHVTSSNTENCSSITCIQNVHDLPSCTKAASGGVECETKSGTSGYQDLYDQPCGTDSGYSQGPYQLVTLQAAADCKPLVQRNRRCLHSCGSGMPYGHNPRQGVVCK